MLELEEALQRILSVSRPSGFETVTLHQAEGRVVVQPALSPVDLPPFDNSAMDGYAVRAADLAGANPDKPAALRVVGYVPAGAAPGPDDRVEAGAAIRIMTGAPVPPGADAVVRFEDTSDGRALDNPGRLPEVRAKPSRIGGEVLVFTEVGRGDNVRATGQDVHAGEVVLRRGTVIR